jgi:hypothetical protein
VTLLDHRVIASDMNTDFGIITRRLNRASFPYALAWYDQHPLKDNPEAFFICNQMTGKKIKPETLWRVMKVLRFRIETLLKGRCNRG